MLCIFLTCLLSISYVPIAVTKNSVARNFRNATISALHNKITLLGIALRVLPYNIFITVPLQSDCQRSVELSFRITEGYKSAQRRVRSGNRLLTRVLTSLDTCALEISYVNAYYEARYGNGMSAEKGPCAAFVILWGAIILVKRNEIC